MRSPLLWVVLACTMTPGASALRAGLLYGTPGGASLFERFETRGTRPNPRAAACHVMMGSKAKEPRINEAKLKLVKGGLPPEIADRLSFQSGGQKQANQEDEILILWREFKKCYPNEAVAKEMLRKNTAVILPQLNSPTKIKGTYALLVKRLGKAGAGELIVKNPGVLVCSPTSLAKSSDAEILNAADMVEAIENNKGVLQAVSGVLLASLVGSIVYKIGTVGAVPPVN